MFTASLTAYGVFVDESVRPDPFTEPSGFWDWFAYRPSHDALAEIPVVPIGWRGILTLRPTSTALINSPDISGLIVPPELSVEPQQSPAQQSSAGATSSNADFTAYVMAELDVAFARSRLALAASDGGPPTAEQIDALQAELDAATDSRDSVRDIVSRGQPPAGPLAVSLARFSPDGSAGWIAVDNAGLYWTTDGGASWAPAIDNISEPLAAFDVSQCGWAVGLSGTQYLSDDSGLRWRAGPDRSPCTREMGRIQFWANGGTVAEGPEQGIRPLLISHAVVRLALLPEQSDGSLILVLDASGSVFSGAQGDDEKAAETPNLPLWQFEISTPMTSSFRAWLDAADPDGEDRIGWAVGDNGALVSVDLNRLGADDETAWRQHPTPTTATLRSIYFQTGDEIGWASSGWFDSEADGGRPVILQTVDGGETWERLHYGGGPAGWVLLIALPGLAFALYGVGSVALDLRNAVEPHEAISDDADSDAPLGWEDRDALGLKPIARALSKFVRNNSTDPPLTFAVTGQWGSGKSSLINLVAEDLRYFDARPVWFNAWHHQRERHLLAALLENIRDQAIPPWWRGSGLAFRLRLLLVRSRKSLAGLLATAMFLLLVAGAISIFHATSLPNLAEDGLRSGTSLVDSWFDLAVGQEETDAEEGEDDGSQAGDGDAETGDRVDIIDRLLALAAGFGTLGIALLTVVAILRRLRVLTLDPAKLMTTLTERSRVGAFRDQLSFRHKFGEEFKDVCVALRTRRSPGMVIMIDDLDRCRPENVLEILEAVNFLATVAPCFIFLGIDEEKVINAVAYGFKDSILELPRNGRQMQANRHYLEPDPQALAKFSEAYLEKLINIVVPVPAPTAETAEKILRANSPPADAVDGEDGEADNQPEAPVSPWPRRIRRLLRSTMDGLLGLIPLTMAGYLLVLTVLLAMPAEQGLPVAGQTPPAAQQIPPFDPEGNPLVLPRVAEESLEQAYPAIGLEAATDGGNWLGWGAPAIALAFILLLAMARLLSVREVEVSDSPDFGRAIALWSPVVYAANPTPRGVKRYKNRLRYFAMRLRGDDRPLDWIDRLFQRREFPMRREPADGDGTIDEATLIAIGALDALDPDLLTQAPADRARLMEAKIRRRQADHGLQLGTDWNTQTMVAEFNKAYPQAWNFGAEDVKRYRVLNRTIEG